MEQRPPLRFLSVREGTKYGPEYTFALKKQVPITVLGDDLPLRTDFKGWFAKIELFAPWNAHFRPFMFFDLDTYLIGDLKPFEGLDLTQFWLIDDFNRPHLGESGVMIVPNSRISDHIWEKRGELRKLSSDGEFFRQFPHKRLNRAVSGIVSYKKHARRQIPENSRIICFHGKPKPHETRGWSKTHWTSLTQKSSTS